MEAEIDSIGDIDAHSDDVEVYPDIFDVLTLWFCCFDPEYTIVHDQFFLSYQHIHSELKP